MDFSEINNVVKVMNSEMERIQTEFRGKMQNLFTEATKIFFEEAPMIKAVVWNQYTPYWNDGEECTFRVNEVFFIVGEDFNIDDYDLQEISWGDIEEEYHFNTSSYKGQDKQTIEKYGQEAYNAVIAMEKIIESNSDHMKAIFGDHALIALLPDRIINEEFDHD